VGKIINKTHMSFPPACNSL